MGKVAIALVVLLGLVPADSPLPAASIQDTCRVIIYPYPELDHFVDLGICDTVRLGCPTSAVNLKAGDSIGVPFYVFNDLPLSGFSLGFHYSSDLVEITSWSMQGSTIPPTGEQQAHAMPEQNLFLTGWFSFHPSDTIPRVTNPHGQLIGTLWMRVLPGAESQIVDVDSARVGPGGKFMLAPFGGGKVSPVYVDCGTEDVVLGVSNCGDVDSSGAVDIVDALRIIQALFDELPAADLPAASDVNCDSKRNIADAVYLVNYVFKSGPQPCAGCK